MGLNEGLVFASHMEDTSDWSGNGNSLTYNGTTLVADKNGVVNKARSFNGSSDNIELPLNLTTATQGSISMWINLNNLDSTQRLFSLSDIDSNNNWFQLDILTDGTLRVYPTGSDALDTENGVILTNTFTYITVTSDSSTIKAYINGIEKSLSNTAGSNTGQWFNSISGVDNIWLGKWKRSSSEGFLDGILDEPRIYNRALTQDEVLQLYKAYDSEADSQVTLDINQIAYYKFDGDVTDTSGNGNNGTNNGATFVTGKINQGASFNGSSDYISSNGYSIGDTYSVSLWFKTSTSQTGMMFSGGGTDTNRYPDIYIDTNNIIRFGGSNTDSRAISTTAYSSGTWMHIVGVAQGTSRKIYVNGVLEDTSTESNNAVFYSTINIGRRGDNTLYFDGIIDEVGIWNRALTATEVSDLYNSGDGQQYPYSTTSARRLNALFFGGGL